jgi:hypothetical protein
MELTTMDTVENKLEAEGDMEEDNHTEEEEVYAENALDSLDVLFGLASETEHYTQTESWHRNLAPEQRLKMMAAQSLRATKHGNDAEDDSDTEKEDEEEECWYGRGTQ